MRMDGHVALMPRERSIRRKPVGGSEVDGIALPCRAMTDESDLDLLVDTTSTITRLILATVQIEAERLLGVRVDARPAQDLSQRWREDPRRSAAADYF
jgi:predicted nucleotidyltransferase